jgi:hypothetical protein
MTKTHVKLTGKKKEGASKASKTSCISINHIAGEAAG